MLKVVTIQEIQKIFAVTDALGIHRESLVIPLAPRVPGVIRKLGNGKIEIVVDADRDLDTWLEELTPLLRTLATTS